MHMAITTKDTGKWLTLGNQSDLRIHPQVSSSGYAEPPHPFLGPYHPPDPWDLGHLPLHCRGRLRSQKCWSPPAAAAPPPGCSACTRPCREPAWHRGWASALVPRLEPSVPSPDTLCFPTPTQALSPLHHAGPPPPPSTGVAQRRRVPNKSVR